MKRITLISLSILLTSIYAFSQGNLTENLTNLKSKIVKITVDNIVYGQSLEILSEPNGKLQFISVDVDDKGKSVKRSFEFYLSDIDKNTVIKKPSGKKMIVNLTVNINQKLIKSFKDDILVGYVSNIEILVAGSDEATALINLITTSIPLIKISDKNWTETADAFNWLKDNVGQITTATNVNAQSFSYDNLKPYLISYSSKVTDLKGVTTEEKYELNVLDINKNEVQFKVSGVNLMVSITTKGNDKLIKYSKNGVLQGYTSNFEIAALDVEQARLIISAINAGIIKSKLQITVFKTINEALDYLKNNTAQFEIDGSGTKQKFEFTDIKGIKSAFTAIVTDPKGKTIENQYEFYMIDIEENTIMYKASGKIIKLGFKTKNNQKFIKYSKDNLIQSYQNDLEIQFDNLENTRCFVEALKYVLTNNKVTPETWPDISAALNFLTLNLVELKTPTEQYTQTFSSSASEPFLCKYMVSKTDSRAVKTDEAYEFYPYLMESNSIEIKPDGKWLTVSIRSSDKKSYVKKSLNGVQQSYDDKIEFMTTDVKQAKDIAEALKYIVKAGKTKAKDWSNKQSAMAFIISNVTNFAEPGKETKQTLEMVENNACKLSLKISNKDAKGAITEELYEFGLPDINKMIVDYKISGKKIMLVLVTKNKNKLIKAYKNGVQQTFASDVEIQIDDIDKARNMVEAFKATIVSCE